MFEIIPAIDIIGGKCVRLTQGQYDKVTTYSEDPAALAREFARLNVARIHVIDLEGAKTGKIINLEAIKKINQSVKIPIQVGGGIRNKETIENLIKIGVQWVILGTKAVQDLNFVKEVCQKFKEKVIIGVDATEKQVMIEGWKKTGLKETVNFAREIEQAGAKIIIFTDIARDGMLIGPNFDSIKEIAAAVNIPIIASGGVTTLQDIKKLKEIKNLAGCIIGKALYEGKINLKEALVI